MWGIKCVIVPVILGATGIVKKDVKKNVESITRKHSVESLQIVVVLGTSVVIRRVIQSET